MTVVPASSDEECAYSQDHTTATTTAEPSEQSCDENSHDDNDDDDDDDDYAGSYGWVCVVCQMLITACTWGINGSFGVYLTHYLTTDAFPGTSQLSYALVGGLAQSQITLAAPLVTLATSRWGTRPPLVLGAVLLSAALVGASFATRAWHLFLAQGLLFGWGASLLYIGTIGIVPQWFGAKGGRSLANGLAAAGSGVGGVAFSLGAEAIIERPGSFGGAPWALRVSAAVAAAVNLACALLIRDRNARFRPRFHGFDLSLLAARPAAWLSFLAFAYFSVLGYTVVLFSLPDNAVAVGLTAHQGSVLGALANAGMSVGRPALGFLGDKLGRVRVVGGATFLAGVFCFAIWTSGTDYPVLLAFSVVGGTVIGTSWANIGPLLADTFGMQLLPSALSITWTLLSFPSLVAEPIALALRRSEEPSYLYVQIFAGAVFVASALCLMGLPLVVKRGARPA